MKNKKKKIMLLPPTMFPIPAVGGGAVEQLITHLLDINEIKQKVQFIVVSKYDEKAASVKYSNSEVLYLNQDGFIMGYVSFFKILWIIYRIWLKVFHNHVLEKIFHHNHNRMDLYAFQCAVLAVVWKVDVVVNELHDFGVDKPLTVFNDIVGSEHFYNHIHSVREENLMSRKIINNSICISEFVKEHWVVNNTIKGNHEVLYNCINVEHFMNCMNDTERNKLRHQLGIRENEFLIIYCGRIAKEKGVEQLLDAIDLLTLQGDDRIKLLFIGSAAFSQGNITEFSKRIMERIRNNSKVITTGYIANIDLPKYYAIADAQIIPSVWQEGAGLVSIEGMAAGLPLIITKSGGLPEYVGEETAIQLPIDDQLSKNIAMAMQMLAQDSELCYKLGSAGKKRAQKFSRESYYDNYINIIVKNF